MQRAFCTLMKTSACRNFSKLTAAFHLPPTKKFSLISLNTRLPRDWKSEGDVKCWHGIQSRLDGCDCINTEGYPCRLSEAWCTALERKRMHGHGTDTIWKAKQDLQGTRPKLHEAEKSESPKKTNSSPTTGLGKQDSKQHLASFVRESSEESNAMVLLLQLHPVRPQASSAVKTTWKTCMGTGKAAPSKTFRMALIDQKKTKEISNSPKSCLRDISVGPQALVAFVVQPEPVRKPEPCDL